MTRDEALELLGLKLDAGTDAIRARMRELYSEYEVRLTNAPTTNLRLSYQRNLSELGEAGRTLLGDDSSLDELKDLPVADPSVPRSAPAQKRVSNEREERDCPHCGEKILAKATRCRHCGQLVAPLAAVGGSPPAPTSSRRHRLLWVVPVVLVGIVGAVAYRFGLPLRYSAAQPADSSRLAVVRTEPESVAIQNVGNADTTRVTPPQQTRKDSVRVNPSVVRRDTAKPTPVVRRDTAKAPTVVTPTVTPRKDIAGYGPYRWGMTIAEVRNIAANHGMDSKESSWDERFGSVTFKSADGFPDGDLLQPYFQCDTRKPVGVLFTFADGLLVSVHIGVNGDCPKLNELATQLVSRYSMKRRWPNDTTWFGSHFYDASEASRNIQLDRGPSESSSLGFTFVKKSP